MKDDLNKPEDKKQKQPKFDSQGAGAGGEAGTEDAGYQ